MELSHAAPPFLPPLGCGRTSRHTLTGVCLLLWILIVGSGLTTYGQMEFSQRSAMELALYPFVHGVASGDPLSDRVIIWTRLTSEDTGSLDLSWRMALDTGFLHVVQSGHAVALNERDYTIKVDVSGLAPATWYYYEFDYKGRKSIVGRTRTAPLGDADSVRVAVLSCTCYQCGYFNPYASIAERNDLDMVIHVGDYFYEYPAEGYGYTPSINRLEEPANEVITLSDYRIRHSWYKLDQDSRRIHQNYPFILIYDDHEFSNDAWKDGAQNHDEATEGSWNRRKRAAYRAWMEWQPVREPELHDRILAYRELPYGNLLDFLVVDTRTERDQQDLARIDDPTRTMLGTEQYHWLVNRIQNSPARWKVMVNQVMMSPLEIFGGAVWSFEQWDGYRAERTRLLDTIVESGVQNFVVFTGDIHSAWVSNLRHLGGSAGVEFVATSSTALNRGIATWDPNLLKVLNPHIKYIDLSRRGYMIVDFNKTRAQCDQLFVPTNLVRSTVAHVGGSWMVPDGETQAMAAPGPSARSGPGPDQPPLLPRNSCFIPQNPETRAISANSAMLEWDDSRDADFYQIQARQGGTEGPVRTRYTQTDFKYVGSLEPGMAYEWRVSSICKDGSVSAFTPWLSFSTPETGLRESDVDEDSTILVLKPILLNLNPMPFSTTLGVHFQVPMEGGVRIELIDMAGNSIYNQALGFFQPGLYFRQINFAEKPASGTYLFRLKSRNVAVERRVIVQ